MRRILFFVLFWPVALLAQTPDPGEPGPYAVTSAEYDFGDEAFDPPSFPEPVEVTGSVHYPDDLSDGPFPVILILHGRHSSCYNPGTGWTSIAWPCTAGYEPIPSYTGYDYLAEQMASHGYIVISVSANSISSTDNSVGDYGMQARGELLQHHLDLWNDWNTVGGDPFGTMFVGKLDMDHIGTLGHSRGGEGVIFHALYNRSLGSPYGIDAVLTLAPVDFNRQTLTGIPLLNVAPYCDGDVSDLQGVHFYDDVRYEDPTDEAPKHSLMLPGGNHNFFNTVWTPGLFPAGTADDWGYVDWTQSDDQCGTSDPGNGRYEPETQRNILLAYASAFFRFYVGGEEDFSPILETNDIIPPASATIAPDDAFMSYHPSNRKKIDLNRLDNEGTESTNSLGGAASQTGLTDYDICGDDFGEQYCLNLGASQEPHCKNGGISMLGLSQLGISWNSADDVYDNELPVEWQNLSEFEYVQFRASVDFTGTASALDFSVELEDASGATASVNTADYTNALFYPPGDIGTTLPRIMHHTIKLPLSAFEGIDLSAVTHIRMQFNGSASGSIFVSDLLISSDENVYLPPVADFSVNVTTTCTGMVQFTDNTMLFPEEWLWDFGDGTTSDEQNPSHTYYTSGDYTVTLTATNPAGSDEVTYEALIHVEHPIAPTAVGDVICAGEEATLSAMPAGGGTLNWYDAPGGSLVYSGDAYTFEPLVSTTYYIQETIESPIEEVGPPDNTFGSGGYFNSNDLRGIFFNVEVPLTIETVKVYSNMAGNRTIQVLAGEGGPVVHSLTMNIPSGEQVIDLNFAMEPGDQYYIKVTGARVDLFRINDGSPDYPYEIPGVISLTGSNVVGAELDYYYYFFDWKIRQAECLSELAPVTASVSPLPDIATIGDVTIPAGGSATLFASGGVSCYWEPATGLDDPSSCTPMASPEETTTYTVTVTTINGCVDTASVVVTVTDDNGWEELQLAGIVLYPQPATGQVQIDGLGAVPVTYLLTDMQGKLIAQGMVDALHNSIELQGIPAGSYMLKLTGNMSSVSLPMIIQ